MAEKKLYPDAGSGDAFANYGNWSDAVSGYNQMRVPNMPALEAESSARIAELLNPPDMFTDTSRMAAENAALRGVPGSGASGAIAARMTDEEKLKRIALGSQLLSAAGARYPTADIPQAESFFVTPAQEQQFQLGWQELNNELAKIRLDSQARQSSVPSGYQQEQSRRVPGFPQTYYNW